MKWISSIKFDLNEFTIRMAGATFAERAVAHILFDEYLYKNGILTEKSLEFVRLYIERDLPKETVDSAIKFALYSFFEKTPDGYKCPFLDKHIRRTK